MLKQITNFIAVNPNLGTAGQPTREQFTAIQAAGYELVINLLPSFSPYAVAEEQTLVTGLGMEYIHIPVIWEEPKPAELEQFFRVMRENQGKKIFVHCAMNMRVSAFVYLYRVMVEGVEEQTARTVMQRIWEPNPTWQEFIEARCGCR